MKKRLLLSALISFMLCYLGLSLWLESYSGQKIFLLALLVAILISWVDYLGQRYAKD